MKSPPVLLSSRVFARRPSCRLVQTRGFAGSPVGTRCLPPRDRLQSRELLSLIAFGPLPSSTRCFHFTTSDRWTAGHHRCPLGSTSIAFALWPARYSPIPHPALH